MTSSLTNRREDPTPTPRPAARSRRPRNPRGWRRWRGWKGLAIGIAVVLALLIGVSFLSDEPLRRSMERRMNASLKGYTTRIGRLRFHPLGLALTLENLTLTQDANPEPKILVIPSLHASVQWKELLALRLVADFVIDRPRIYVNLVQLRSENDDAVPVKDRGWQRAIEQIYPLKINRVNVRQADVTTWTRTRNTRCA